MARTLRRLAPPALAAALALLSASPAGAAGKLVEQTVDVPRETRVQLALSFDKSTIFGLESQNDPKPEDVEEARAKDPEDKTWVLLRFFYRNEGWTKQKVRLRAVLLDENGGVLADSDDSTPLGKQKKTLGKQKTEETVSFPMKVGTLDWGRAAKMKIFATFLD